MKWQINITIKKLLLVIALVFLICLPIYSYLFVGPFLWHIKQPEALNGIIEILAIYGLICSAYFIKNRNIKILFLILISEFYCRRYATDLPIILIIGFFYGIYSLGELQINKLVEESGYSKKFLIIIKMILGLSIYYCYISILYILSDFSIVTIRLLVILLIFISIYNNKNKNNISFSINVSFLKWALLSFVFTIFLMLFAKAASPNTPNYDSMWYGLTLDRYLIGSDNIFKPQGLVAMVHYFPKVIELILIPFSGLGIGVTEIGINILLTFICIYIIAEIMRISEVKNEVICFAILLILTTPAVSHVSITTKGDILSLFYFLSGYFFYIANICYKKLFISAIALLCCALAVLSKISSAPYATILFLIIIVQIYRLFLDNKKINFKEMIILLPTFLAILFICYRAISISGLLFQTPNELVNIQNYLGLYSNFPVGGIEADKRVALPFLNGLLAYTFFPSIFPTLLITWTGNAWLLLGAASWLFSINKSNNKALLLIGCLFPIVLFFQKTNSNHGSDGNYFIIPITCLIMYFSSILSNSYQKHRNFFISIFSIYSLVFFIIIFVTIDWGPGTKSFDFRLNRSVFIYGERFKNSTNILEAKGLSDYFNLMPKSTRVIGFEGENSGSNSLGWILPIQFESLNIIAWSRPEFLLSSKSLSEFIINNRIEYIVIDNKNKNNLIIDAINILINNNDAFISFNDSRYTVYKINIKSQIDYIVSGAKKSEINIKPIDSSLCKNFNNIVITFNLNFSTDVPVNIFVKGATASEYTLFAQVGHHGAISTGGWVSKDANFRFVDANSNQSLGHVVIKECKY